MQVYMYQAALLCTDCAAPIISAAPNPEMPASFVPGVAARPTVAVSAPTMGSVARSIGPEGMAAVVGHPEGRALLKEQGVHTAEQFQQKKQRAQALEEFKTFGEEMQTKYAAGDPLGGLLAERAGYRALAAGAADPSSLLSKANEITKEYAREFERAKKDTEYKKHLVDDGRAYAQGMTGYLDAVKFDAKERAAGRPSDTAALKLNGLLEASMTFKSDFGQRKRDVLLSKIEEGVGKQILNEPLARLNSTTAAVLNQQIAKGQKPDYEAARQEAFRSNPDGIGALLEASMTHKTPLSDADLGALGIKGVPKTNREEAAESVLRGDPATGRPPIPSSDPRFLPAFTAKLTEIEKSRQRPPAAGISPESRTAQRIQAMYLSLGREANSKRRSLDAIKAKYTYKPGDPTAKPVEDEIEKIEAERANLYQQFMELTGIRPSEEAKTPPPGAAAPAGGLAERAKKDPAGTKAARDATTEKLFPGRPFAKLTPQEQAKVATEMMTGTK